MSLLAGLCQETRDGRGIEVEHLRACELSFTDFIKAQHLSIKPFSGGTYSALPPKDDHFVLARSHNARIHSPLYFSRLERVPRLGPSPGFACAVRKRRRPVNFEIRM